MTTNAESPELVNALLKQVEDCLHRRLVTPSDFEWASECIDQRTRTRLSRTTLMRLWGYVREPVVPRQVTLSTLARFCGYADWAGFVEHSQRLGERESDPVMGDRIDVLDDQRGPAGTIYLAS